MDISNNINYYSKGSNVAGTKGDVNFGSNPYKIKNDKFDVKVNTEFGVVVFDIESNGIKLKYIISALTQ